MFSRHNDRPPTEEARQDGLKPATPSGVRDAVAVPISSQPSAASRSEESVVGREDRFEGTLKTQRGLRIQGQLEGHIEAATYVHIEEGARVNADLTADEAVISGLYSGKLTCRQRCEIRSTGQVKGEIETVRLMLHEGGFIDGELHMQRPAGSAAELASNQGDALRSGISPRTTATSVEATARPTATSGVSSSSH